jgi:hypothetical protein
MYFICNNNNSDSDIEDDQQKLENISKTHRKLLLNSFKKSMFSGGSLHSPTSISKEEKTPKSMSTVVLDILVASHCLPLLVDMLDCRVYVRFV